MGYVRAAAFRTALVCALLAPAATFAADLRIDPSMNYRSVLLGLEPGDTAIAAPGRYTQGFPIRDIAGTAAQPIVVVGPSTEPRAIIEGRTCCNSISIANAAYVTVRSFDIDGMGRAVDAVKAENDSRSAHHITLEDLHIYNHGATQQTVGISTKCPSWDWNIRYNVIERSGTGLYLGNSDGADPFIRGVIEYNVVLDPTGYAMEIKHQLPRPNVAGIPSGDAVTIIRHNVFSKATNASRGGSSRPNVLVGHWPLSGQGGRDRYELYGNFFYQNEASEQALFQGEGNIAFHDNVLVNTFGPGIWIQPHNDTPRDIAVYHNTVYTRGEGILVVGAQGGVTPVVAANAVFADIPIDNEGSSRGNITDARGQAANYVANTSAMLGTLDLFPLPGALDGAAVDLSAFAGHIDADLDFNGEPRTGSFRGAYAGAGRNPGWRLARETKPGGVRTPPPAPHADAGQPQPADAGSPTTDAGSTTPDTGSPAPDAGATPEPDAGPAAGDAASMIDAGTTEPSDAGTAPGTQNPGNGGRATSRRGVDGGCACTAPQSDSTAIGVLLLAGMIVALRKRR